MRNPFKHDKMKPKYKTSYTPWNKTATTRITYYGKRNRKTGEFHRYGSKSSIIAHKKGWDRGKW